MILIAPVTPESFQPTLGSPFADSTQFDITPLYDSLGLLDRYLVFVNTPICEVEQCYQVQLNLYTDLIGNFLHYDTLEGHELTKLDHIPFTSEDYQRLRHILSDDQSILSAYDKEELVENTRASEIEGFTGATVLEVKANVIEGAVYSCHTLWHIAHGPLMDSLQSRTAALLNPSLMDKLVDQNRQDINYFLINHCTEEEFAQYLPQLLRTIEQGAGYYPKNALEKIPAGVLNSQEAQKFFVHQFTKLDYFAQVALLKKLDRDALTENLKEILKGTLDQRSSLRNDLIQELTESP